MIDLHVHTEFCPHAKGSIGEIIRQAFEYRKLEVLGFSEHLPFPDGFADPLGDCNMAADDVGSYVDEVKAHASYHDILCGAEIDYLPGYEDQMIRWCEDPRFDYLIGSVHLIGGWAFDYGLKEFRNGLSARYGGDILALAEQYYGSIVEMASFIPIQIVGHFDLVKKFDVEGKLTQDARGYERMVDDALEVIANKGLCIEVNTAGMRKPVGRMYPEDWIIKKCADLEIPMTVGSDSHLPSEVGRDIDKAIDALRAQGIGEVHFFRGRIIEAMQI